MAFFLDFPKSSSMIQHIVLVVMPFTDSVCCVCIMHNFVAWHKTTKTPICVSLGLQGQF